MIGRNHKWSFFRGPRLVALTPPYFKVPTKLSHWHWYSHCIPSIRKIYIDTIHMQDTQQETIPKITKKMVVCRKTFPKWGRFLLGISALHVSYNMCWMCPCFLWKHGAKYLPNTFPHPLRTPAQRKQPPLKARSFGGETTRSVRRPHERNPGQLVKRCQELVRKCTACWFQPLWN